MKAEVERRTILNLGDVDALRRLLADEPGLARRRLERFGDHRRGVQPLALTAMLRFEARGAGLAPDLPGTGAMAQALIDAGAPIEGEPGVREPPLITAASYVTPGRCRAHRRRRARGARRAARPTGQRPAPPRTGCRPDLRDPDHGRTPLEWCQPENRYPSQPGHNEVDRIIRRHASPGLSVLNRDERA
jgi:hypothetical protein